jgi:hypothetical protein
VEGVQGNRDINARPKRRFSQLPLIVV